jgi:CheY-like chemotaxis protein
MAEDDPEDRLLVEDALEESRVVNDLYHVSNGEELLDFLYQRNEYEDPAEAPRPDLILLDLNMPRMDGREALAQIKADDDLRRIPVVVLTSSEATQDVIASYDLQVSGYITKPVTFEGLVDVVQTLHQYWFGIVKLPPQKYDPM